jgi:uncharacterized protein (TIGR03083 family)
VSDPSPWPQIHAERRALLDDLEPLADDQWRTPSLCDGWTVHHVLGHITATARTSAGGFFANLAKAGFRFNSMIAQGVARESSGTPSATLAGLRQEVDATIHPPGPMDTWLGEIVVHSEDIRRPLGIRHEFPPQVLSRVATFYTKSNAIIGGRTRAKGLGLRATDADWTAGSGPEVSGPLLSIVLALTGRQAALADLSGDGLETLRTRM